MINIPLSFEAWCVDTDIEEKYQLFHDEYGDAACLLSEYKQKHYQEYLFNFKNNNKKWLSCGLCGGTGKQKEYEEEWDCPICDGQGGSFV